ncbi:hypothetical protein ATY35_15655 [Vibrio cidicii]|uniref:Uncharacterized protein n=1 Tax=Vibrio cidicii TaxID=1763883 RepID=A0ABR5W0Z1_9VIBR|nr:hypothetical protein ATY35_15655 [Vibrio cidicii]
MVKYYLKYLVSYKFLTKRDKKDNSLGVYFLLKYRATFVPLPTSRSDRSIAYCLMYDGLYCQFEGKKKVWMLKVPWIRQK